MKKIFKLALTSLLILSSFNLMAVDDAMVEMLKTMKIDKSQVSQMVDQLQQMGRITPEQAAKAKKELSVLTEKDLDVYKNAAVKKIKSGDAQRLIDHDYTKGQPKLETPSVVEIQTPVKTREPASTLVSPQPESKDKSKIDFSKLGQ
jgi:DNA-binding MarR family transcriptional regulator